MQKDSSSLQGRRERRIQTTVPVLQELDRNTADAAGECVGEMMSKT